MGAPADLRQSREISDSAALRAAPTGRSIWSAATCCFGPQSAAQRSDAGALQPSAFAASRAGQLGR